MKETTAEVDTRNVVKNRELLYRMIISQLYYDGFQPIAATLAAAVHADPPCPPSDRLLNLMMVGLQHEPDRKDRLAASSGAEHLLGTTGFDVERMLAKSAPEEVDPGREQQGHPVIRTLYDHTDEITALDFHPREQILVSASRDCCIKLFDITKASAKKAYKSITDAEQVLCVAFHPLGDHIIASSTQPVIRLYDVTTSACFVCPIPSHHHTKQVNSIQFSPNGKYFASGSADGCVKLWDTVSNRCFNTFINAHDGSEVCSVAFTRNSKYLLTSGLDSSIKLWELASSRCLIQYTGAGTTGKQEHHAQAVFNHTEDYSGTYYDCSRCSTEREDPSCLLLWSSALPRLLMLRFCCREKLV
ncbi:hypothetical protein B5X24_HaOG210917 [Helicoverpa armigera]|uniref:Cleavage stimulation factor 50 kDa subunit n=1 Tax=Helicoverpa armigera TaxID=29058 RepID=A0A2W1BIC8_HELAM|nr:hypothetical protein B5X24_HaOG210917 [Helicoverpa armigera]